MDGVQLLHILVKDPNYQRNPVLFQSLEQLNSPPQKSS